MPCIGSPLCEPPMSNVRQQKVAAEVRKVLSYALHTEVRDPRVVLVTITHVRMTTDLQLARVYWTTSDEGPIEETQKALDKASSFLRRQLASSLSMRRVPQIIFHYDETLKSANKMEDLLSQLRASGQMGTDE